MLTQTLALFIDSYRELSAKKIFWIAVAISGLLVLAIAGVGFSADGDLTLLWYETDFPAENIAPRDVFYKIIFVNLGIGIWLAWGATILALASTAGVFPDFLEGGAIDLALSKPIGRTRLFLTKFAASLLFVALQVAVFAGLAFLVIGWRGGAWEPAIFLAVPLVTLFYSFLYAVCALLGIVTRSAITALILTLLFWFFIFLVHSTESALLFWKTQSETRVHGYETTIAKLENRIEENPLEKTTTRERVEGYNAQQVARVRLENAQSNLESAREQRDSAVQYHGYALAAKTILPKTAETIGLLERWLIDAADLPAMSDDRQPPVQIDMRIDEDGEMTREMREAQQRITAAEMQRELRSRSVWWILGTSILFEAAVLALACWRFNRKDF